VDHAKQTSNDGVWFDKQGIEPPNALSPHPVTSEPQLSATIDHRWLWELGLRILKPLDALVSAVGLAADESLFLSDHQTLPAIRAGLAALFDSLPRDNEELSESLYHRARGADSFVDIVWTLDGLAKALLKDLAAERTNQRGYWNTAFKKWSVCEDVLRKAIVELESLPELHPYVLAEARRKLQEPEQGRAIGNKGSDAPPRPGDMVELPNSDIGLVEAMPNYPDETLHQMLGPANEALPTEAAFEAPAGEATTVKAAPVGARRLADLALERHQVLDDAAGDASLPAGNSYHLRNCLLPPLHEPQSLMASMDLLVYVLERHRLIFLHFMSATRVNPLAVTGRTGSHERVTRQDMPWNEQYVKQIDCDGEFLFRCRWFLDNYAAEAISRFGPGSGVKPDVDGASHPYWSLEEGGAGYLQESTDTIHQAVRHVQRLDSGRQFDVSVQRAIEVAYDRSNSRWYSPLVTRWEYLFELDSAIAEIKRDALLLARPPQTEQTTPRSEEGWFYLNVTYDESIFNHDPDILGQVVGDPNYLPVDSGTLHFFKVKGLLLAQRLVRLFDRRVKPQIECEGETRLQVSFSFQAADEFDDDALFLADEEIQQARDSLEMTHQKWRMTQGMRVRNGVVIAGHELVSQRPPLERQFSTAHLYDQALRWCEKLVADKPTEDSTTAPKTEQVTCNEINGDGPTDPEVLRVALPTAVVAAAGLRDLLRIRKFYPDAIPEAEANSLHEQLVANLVSSAKVCKLEGLFEIAPLPEPGQEGSDLELSSLMGILALNHPDSDEDALSAENMSENLAAVVRKCQGEATEPVRDIVTRIQHAMLYDCRMPDPRDDDTFREPQRFLQMLRAYWGLIRRVTLYLTEAPVSYRPFPLTPLIINLRNRVSTCLEKLGACLDVASVQNSIGVLTEIVLSGNFDELQMGDEWASEQVASVDRFIEEARLQFGAKTYPLTHAEEICLEQGRRAVSDYEKRIASVRNKMSKRMDDNSNKSTAQASANLLSRKPVEPTTGAAVEAPGSEAANVRAAAVEPAPESKAVEADVAAVAELVKSAKPQGDVTKSNEYRRLWEIGQRVAGTLDDLHRAVGDLFDVNGDIHLGDDALAKVAAAALHLKECCAPCAGPTLPRDVDDPFNVHPPGRDGFVNLVASILEETKRLIIALGLSRTNDLEFWQKLTRTLWRYGERLAEEVSAIEALPELRDLVYAEALRKVQELQVSLAFERAPEAGDFVPTPDGMDVGIVEPLSRYSDEMFAAMVSSANQQAEPATESKGTVEAKQKKVTKADAEKLANKYLFVDKLPWPGVRTLAAAINYHESRVVELPSVRRHKEEFPEQWPNPAPKAVGISEANEASISIGERHGVLNELIAKEEAENEAQRIATQKMAELIQQAEEQAAENRADFAPRKHLGSPIGRRRKP
jgi:hypothetical protein